jgi:hypothetical protein
MSKFSNEEDDSIIRLTIKSRILCHEVSDKFNKCKNCQAVLTDSIDWEQSTDLVEYYEPNQKRELVFAYCELLRSHVELKPEKGSLHDQLIEQRP